MKCATCHKYIWPWQEWFKRIRNLWEVDGLPMEIRYFHMKCEKFGESIL